MMYDFFGNVVAQTPGWKSYINIYSAVNNVITSNTDNKYFNISNNSGYTIIANGINNTFYGINASDTLLVRPNSGTNTVYVSSNYILPANIQNMVVAYAKSGVMGNSLSNYITCYSANITIDGNSGNDVLTGATGNNFRFDANSGFDVITNFQAGARTSNSVNPETVQLSGYSQFSTFAQVTAAMTQSGSDVILTLDANDAIKFNNTTVGNFTADNFLLNSPVNTAAMTMSFDEEFDGALNASGNGSALWMTNYDWGQDPNAARARTLTGEKELYVDPSFVSNATGQKPGINPFSVTSGALDIHAAPAPAGAAASLYGYNFTSGMLSTRSSFTQTYGYFETSMKLPAGGGAWPAFWLYSATGDSAEIDVMESHSADSWTATQHDWSTGRNVAGFSTIYTPDLSTAYHAFGLLWTATTITWYLDGVAVRSIATPADMHGPMYMMLGLALDGSTPANFSGADLNVAYVHAYSLGNLPSSVTGSAGGGPLNDAGGASSLIGAGGNDTFYVSRSSTKVVEAAGWGVHLVYASDNYTLPTNVAKLILTGAATTATSNSAGGTLIGNNNGDTLTGGTSKDIIIGGTGNDTIIAGSGQDFLTGGGGNDLFVFGATIGNDYIKDFNVANDRIDISAFNSKAFTLRDYSGGAILNLGGPEQIVFSGQLSANLLSSGAFHPSSISLSGSVYSGKV